MFPFFGAQPQQSQQSSNPLPSVNNVAKVSEFDHFVPLPGSVPSEPLRAPSNPFACLPTFNSTATDATSSQIGFGTNLSFTTPAPNLAGFQSAGFAPISSFSNLAPALDQGTEKNPPKSVFADFLKFGKPAEPVSGPNSSGRSLPQVCTFFQKGSCRNGDKCPFLHETTSSDHGVDASGKFVITVGRATEPRFKSAFSQDSRSKTICRYFLAGACLKGESCKFSHDTKSVSDEERLLDNVLNVTETESHEGHALLTPSTGGFFTKKASPTHAGHVSLNTDLVSSDDPNIKLGESMAPFSAEDEADTDPASEEALITARARRFRGNNSFVPEAPISLLSPMDELVDEEEPEFASGSACIVGTLMTMCSEEEIRKRDLEMDVHILESVQDDAGKVRTARRADPEKMVKKYQRSAAGMGVAVPAEVRPPIILAKTADYLFTHVLDSTLVPPLDIYNFLRDRFRAIRKDFALQDQAETLAATVHEQIARYFILSHHELCEEKDDDFQKFQNLQQISHTITSLNHYYKDLRLKNGVATPSEAEFYSYQILLNMTDANKLNDCFMNLPVHIRSAPLICVARELGATFRVLNYARFFSVLKTRATYLQRCCVHGFLWGFRSRALKVIYNGMGPIQSTFPLLSLIDILGFDDLDEALHFCKRHGITVMNNEMVKTTSPMEEDVKVEWMRSRVLIGPPKPSRKAVIMSDEPSLTPSENPVAPAVEKMQMQQTMLSKAAELDRKKAEEEQRVKEIAAKEEAHRLLLIKFEEVSEQMIRRSRRNKKLLIVRSWRDIATSSRAQRYEQKRQQQLQIAQRKFSEQKAYLTALSKLARLFLTHVWLNRWRSRSWSRKRANHIALMFRRFCWFRKWNHEAGRVRQFKRLVRAKPAAIDVLPSCPTSVSVLQSPTSSPSFMELLIDRVENSPNRPCADIRVRFVVSVPALKYSDAPQSRLFSDFSVCTAILKTLSIDDTPASVSKCTMRGGFSFELNAVRTTGPIVECPIQGVIFLISKQDSLHPLKSSELLRFRALAELDPNAVVVVIYCCESPDLLFEQKIRSRLPSHLDSHFVIKAITSELNLARILAESVEFFVNNKILSNSDSFVTLGSVIRLRAKEIVALRVSPAMAILTFNQSLRDISVSISRQASADKLELVREVTAVIGDHMLREMQPSCSCSIQDSFSILSGYVHENFQSVATSEPIISRMLQVLSVGPEAIDPSHLVSVIINCRVDALILKLSTRGLDSFLCSNVPPLSISNNARVELLAASLNKDNNKEIKIGSQSPTQKKRNREATSLPSIRDLKRKLLQSEGPSFEKKVDELLSQISR